MLKDTRKLFKFLLANSDRPWTKNNEVFSTDLGITCYDGKHIYRIYIEANGAFQVSALTATESSVIDKAGSTSKSTGLLAYKDKQDRDLVKKLWLAADQRFMERYTKDIATLP